MTNHPGAQSHDNQAVIIELPNGSTEKIAVRDKLDLTVRDLKITCELQFGIPCNLQQLCALESPGQELSDWSPLKETIQNDRRCCHCCSSTCVVEQVYLRFLEQ